jgi:hypothetical protein
MARTALTAAVAVFAAAAACTAGASEFEDRLNQRYRGAWGVLAVEVASGCSGLYSDNEVGEIGVASRAEHRFAPGELVRIDKVNTKRRRVDLLLTLDVPLRTPRQEGPFELFDDHVCQVQLMVPFEREHIKEGDDEVVSSRIAELLTIYPTREEAVASAAWNGRQPPPLPEDYDETLRQYSVWKADEVNTAVARQTARALEAAALAATSLRGNSEFLEGFGAGARAMSSFSTFDCAALLDSSIAYRRTSAPTDKSSSWRDGWDAGQRLILNVLVADRLQSCTMPVPTLDEP